MINFVGEDKRQEMRLLDMQDKYNQILKIFYTIQTTKADDKLTTIESYREEMLSLHQKIISKNKEIKRQAIRVQEGMKETVDLEGLATKIYGKYLKFLQQKVHEIFDSPNADKNKEETKKDKKLEK